MRRAFLLGFGLLAFAVCAAPASVGHTRSGSFTVLYNFCAESFCEDGQEPLATVTLDSKGDIFGSTVVGGNLSEFCDSGCGTIYELRQRHGFPIYHRVYSFCSQKNCNDGAAPMGALIMDVAGNFYGITQGKGKHGYGTVFSITPKGKLTVLHTFCEKSSCSDGAGANSNSAPLTYAGASSGKLYDGVSPLYGTTYVGGNFNSGVVFKMAPTDRGKWKYSVAYKFCSLASCGDGSQPIGLIADDNGTLYGQTHFGAFGSGTVFKLSGSTITVLHTFCSESNCTDGSKPLGAVAVDKSGNVFGTTQEGGNANKGVLYEVNAGGTYSVLHQFCSEANCTDGGIATAPPAVDKSGNLIGTTAGGGDKNAGVIYKYKSSNYQVLYSFCPNYPTCDDGESPNTPITLDSAGNIFGVTIDGGSEIYGGTVFELSH